MQVRAGIFDSGVGGLTVAEALHRLAPSLPISYLADTAFFPARRLHKMAEYGPHK